MHNLKTAQISFLSMHVIYINACFHLSGKKLGYLHLKEFLKHKCALYLKQSLTPPHCKIVVTNCTSTHSIAIEIKLWLTIPTSKDNSLCHFCSNNAADNEAYFVLECPLYNFIKDKFQSLFEKVVIGSLKSFFN
jgi:hypothetical protein